MPTFEEFQANRLSMLRMLNEAKKKAYSGLTAEEYYAIKTTYLFIKMRYELSENDRKGYYNG